MNTQLYLSGLPHIIDQVVTVSNRAHPSMIRKPKPGTCLWTSTYDQEISSEWVEWCEGAGFGEPYEKHWYLLTPNKYAHIYEIDNLTNLLLLMETYPYGTPIHTKSALEAGFYDALDIAANSYQSDIDFERVALDYDAIHLTSHAAGALHLSVPVDLNTWDCESTVWFRWCFTNVERIEPKVREEA